MKWLSDWISSICRIEKEKSLLKSELDDLRGQIDHVNKGKVTINRLNFLGDKVRATFI